MGQIICIASRRGVRREALPCLGERFVCDTFILIDLPRVRRNQRQVFCLLPLFQRNHVYDRRIRRFCASWSFQIDRRVRGTGGNPAMRAIPILPRSEVCWAALNRSKTLKRCLDSPPSHTSAPTLAV